MKPLVKLLRLGLRAYEPTWKFQKQLVEKVKSERKDNFLIFVEHSPVYTTGIRSNVYDVNEELRLKNLGAEFYRSNRGGLITFHGPGQLVAYPILDLRQFVPNTSNQSGKRLTLMGMKWYVDILEEIVIQTLGKNFGLNGYRSPDTGVWVQDSEGKEKKICAMGVHNSDLVTCHGLALNCNIDLNWYNHIVPCGIVGKGVTSLSQELEKEVKIEDVDPMLVEQFEENLGCHIKPVDILNHSEYSVDMV